MRKQILSAIMILTSYSAIAESVSRPEAAKHVRDFFSVVGNETRIFQGQVTHPMFTTRYYEDIAKRSKGDNVTVNAKLTIGPVTPNWTAGTYDAKQSLLINASSDDISVIQSCADHTLKVCRTTGGEGIDSTFSILVDENGIFKNDKYDLKRTADTLVMTITSESEGSIQKIAVRKNSDNSFNVTGSCHFVFLGFKYNTATAHLCNFEMKNLK